MSRAPFVIGKDARDWEALLWELYRYNSNYKFQGFFVRKAQQLTIG
jgi:hypothetical protein